MEKEVRRESLGNGRSELKKDDKGRLRTAQGRQKDAKRTTKDAKRTPKGGKRWVCTAGVWSNNHFKWFANCEAIDFTSPNQLSIFV